MQLTAAYDDVNKKLAGSVQQYDITVKRLTQIETELKTVTVNYNNTVKVVKDYEGKMALLSKQVAELTSANTNLSQVKVKVEKDLAAVTRDYKDCFKLMDINKDGTLDKNDLRGAFDNIGVLMSESELDDLMGEVGGPCDVTVMINMFQEKMAGDGNDPDDLILQAFMAYDLGGKIDVKMFQHALRTWGDKMSNAEIDDIFEQFDVDEDYMVKTKEVLGLFVAVKEEEKKEEKKEEVVVEAAAEDEGDDAKKKKKKKKKAAK